MSLPPPPDPPPMPLCKQRRLLYISHPFPPRVQAGTFRTVRFLRYLEELGWTTQVLTLQPTGISYPYQCDLTLNDLIPPSVHVEAVSAWHPYKYLTRTFKGLLSRKPSVANLTDTPASNGISISKSRWKQSYECWRDLLLLTPDANNGWVVPAVMRALRVIRRFRPDVIVVTTPPHSSQLVGAVLTQVTGIPLVLDFRDPWARAPWSTAESATRKAVNGFLESMCVRSAAHVVLNTPQLRDDFRARYKSLPADRFTSITNGYDPDLRDTIEAFVAASPPRLSDEPWTLVHAGALYGQRNPDGLFRALRLLKEQGVSVRLQHYGAIPEPDAIRASMRKHDVESMVNLSPALPHRALLEQIARCDGILILQPGTHLQVPSKLFESMLFNKPLLGLTGPGATREIMVQYGLGAVAANDNPVEIQAALCSLMSGEGVGSGLRHQAQALYDFHARTLTAQLHDVLTNVLQSRPDKTPTVGANDQRTEIDTPNSWQHPAECL